LIATATALVAIGAVLAGCTSPVAPDVRFSAEKLTISLPTMVVGVAISETLPEAMGGEEGLAYSLSPAVPGLTFDAATRVLSGTPTTPGTYDMTYTAKDSATGGTMESVTFTITVEPAALTPAESLMGAVWVHEDSWTRDDIAQGPRRYMLVFTKNRWIAHFAHFRADETFDEEESYTQSGTWTATDTEITRTWYDDDTLRSLTKEYSWVNDQRTALLLKNWEVERTFEDVHYWLYTKSAPEADLTGTWRYERWEEHEEDDGNFWREFRTWTLEITGDVLTYIFTEQLEEDFGTDKMGVWILTGTLEQDTEEMVLWQTVTSVSLNGEPQQPPSLIGQRLRWGYLQVGNALIISPFWDELSYDDALGWMDNPDVPFGDYWLRLVKQ
jgi:hypothetical protein